MTDEAAIAATTGIQAIKSRDISLTFAKGLAVLASFDEESREQTLAEIALATGLDRAIARRLVLTLLKQGFVRQNGRRFSLTPRVLILAAGFLRANDFGRLVQPALDACAAELGQAVALAMADGDHAVYVAQSSGSSARFTIGLTVGSRLPLLSTALGRALLAFGEEVWAQSQIENAPLLRHTPHTRLDRQSIDAELALARNNGYALVTEEFEHGIYGLAAPVGTVGSAHAALGMTDLMSNMSDERIEQAAIILRGHAGKLAGIMG